MESFIRAAKSSKGKVGPENAALLEGAGRDTEIISVLPHPRISPIRESAAPFANRPAQPRIRRFANGAAHSRMGQSTLRHSRIHVNGGVDSLVDVRRCVNKVDLNNII